MKFPDDPRTILVLQTNLGGLSYCEPTFDRLHYINGKHYTCTVIPYVKWLLRDYILDNQPQLLITGIVSNDMTGVRELVTKLQKKNPKLAVIIFSVYKNIPGDFAMMINKNDLNCHDQLREAILQFLYTEVLEIDPS